MNIKIITDSSSDISQDEAKKLGITVIPMKTNFGEKSYLDDIDLKAEDFYIKLAETEKLPTTNQVSPFDFEEAMWQAREEKAEHIIIICMASSLSGTWQSANIAKENYGGNVYVIDSGTTTFGLQILVKYAVMLRDSGMPAEEIFNIIETEKNNVCIYAVVDTLEYLYKGGRISRTSAFTGALLKIKPLLSMCKNELKPVGKCQGLKKAYAEVFNLVEKAGGIDYTKPYVFGYSGSREQFAAFEQECRQRYQNTESEPIIGCIGSIVGTHVGPGAAAVVFFKK